MSEVTVETFREAALKAGRRMRGEENGAPVDAEKSLKDKIRDILKAEGIMETSPERVVSTLIAERIADALWPEKSLEIKKKRAEMEVERGALIGYIRDILKEGT